MALRIAAIASSREMTVSAVAKNAGFMQNDSLFFTTLIQYRTDLYRKYPIMLTPARYFKNRFVWENSF